MTCPGSNCDLAGAEAAGHRRIIGRGGGTSISDDRLRENVSTSWGVTKMYKGMNPLKELNSKKMGAQLL